MTDRELRRLSRMDLLELALRYAKRNRDLRRQVKELRVRLEEALSSDGADAGTGCSKRTRRLQD